MLPTLYKFADFTLDAREETLTKNGDSVKLKSRPFQVLRLLVENAEKVVTKEEFFEQIWQGAFVEDNNLTVAVTQIRRALGETKETKFVETVPRKGYRFIADVARVFDQIHSTEVEQDFDKNAAAELFAANIEDRTIFAEKPAAATATQSVFAAIGSHKILALAGFASVVFLVGAVWRSVVPIKIEPLRRIAVLPFAVGANSPDEREFAEQLTEELTYNLGRITDAQISAYTAVADYDAPGVDFGKIETDLRVDGLIVGKLRANGGAIDLAIELNDLRSGRNVWEKRYVLLPKELPESQFRIARDIAQQLGKNGKSENLLAAANYEAYQAYLTARHALGKQTTKDYAKAIENFTLAIAKDAAFADAHAGLATTHVLHGLNLYAARGLTASRESFPAARLSAERALLLDPNSDEALAALAFINYRSEYDWTAAENNFRRAIEINPNNIQARRWFGEFLHKTGRFDEGLAVQHDALTLAPNSWQIFNEMAWGAYLAGRFDEAARYAEQAQAIDNTNAAALYNLSEIYECKKDYARAAALWKEAMIIEEANRKWIARLDESFQTEGYLGFVRAKTEWLENLTEKDYIYPTDLAKGYAALGENDKAIEWLTKGAAARVPDMLSLRYAPAFNSLRGDARFQNIIRQMNFPL